MLIKNKKNAAVYPLSNAQKSIWFFYKIKPDSPYYNINSLFEIAGNLDATVFKKCLETIINRHESLRTNFIETKNGPIQIINENAKIKLKFVDLSGIQEKSKKEKRNAIIKLFIDKPFKLETDLLVRTILIKNNKKRGYLLLIFHHLVADEWSVGIFIKELLTLYDGYITGKEGYLSDLSFKYSNFVKLESGAKHGKKIKKQEKYWLKKLKGSFQPVNMPLDRPRPAEASFKGDHRRAKLDNASYRRLKRFSQKNGITLYSALLSVFFVFTRRISGQKEIVIGTPANLRAEENDFKTIGMFVNMLAIRAATKSNDAFDKFSVNAQKEIIKAARNKYFPFFKIAEKMNPARNFSRLSAPNVVFQLKRIIEAENRQLKLSQREYDDKVAKFDLHLVALESKNGLEFKMIYNRDVFKPETVQILLNAFLNLTKEIVKNPYLKIADYNLSSLDNIKKIREINKTDKKFRGRSIIELFNQKAKLFPEKIAIKQEGKFLTYQDLDKKSNQLAKFLSANGLKKGQIVAVKLSRKPDLAVAMLGILKIGAIYLPIDNNYPEERVKYIIKNSRAGYTIEDNLPLDNIYKNYSDRKISITVKPNEAIYAIYTSGTTGLPKGIKISQQSALNTILDINEKFKVAEKDKLLAISSIGFDLSVYDILGALIAGGTIILTPNNKDLNLIIRYAIKFKATIWNSAPSFLESVLNKIGHKKIPSLRLVMLSGDWIPLQLLKKIKRHFPKAKIISLGGATEASIWSIYYPIKSIDKRWESVPYGRPLSNQKIYVLDKDKQICPCGLKGEIYIGGRGLALGYINDDKKTKTAFIKHNKLGRLYRTGDWGRFLPDGNVEFLGRIDNQVKIGGVRIELKEIENVLSKYDSIKSCLVAARENARGEKYLIAYYQAKIKIAESKLKAHLRKKLPDSMVPSFFIHQKKWPLNSSGKVDKNLLPAPQEKKMAAGSGVRHKNRKEAMLYKIWQEMLGLKKIGVNDGFFESGGNSLKAFELVSKISEAGYRMEMGDIFKHDTIRKLAKIIKNKK